MMTESIAGASFLEVSDCAVGKISVRREHLLNACWMSLLVLSIHVFAMQPGTSERRGIRGLCSVR